MIRKTTGNHEMLRHDSGDAMTDEDLLWICEIAVEWIEHAKTKGHSVRCLMLKRLDASFNCECELMHADDDIKRIEETERLIQAWRKQKHDFFASMRKPWNPSEN